MEMAWEAGIIHPENVAKTLEAFAKLVREEALAQPAPVQEPDAEHRAMIQRGVDRTTPPVGDIRALKHRIHELEGELIGYKKIVADQDAMLERQTARIVDLQTHIENFDGEDR
jgi:archaellum component FlaC